MKTAERLKQLEEQVFNLYGVSSRPAGADWVKMVLDLARLIVNEGLTPTPEDLDELTAENYHTARHAAEVVQRLARYS